MKILNLMKILLLCVMTAGLASCGDDNYYTTLIPQHYYKIFFLST